MKAARKMGRRASPTADTQHPASVFAARIRAALAHDRAEGAHVRTFCDPVGFDPSAADVIDTLATYAAEDVEAACEALCVARPLRAAVACRLAEHWPIHDIEEEPPEDLKGLDAAAQKRAQWLAGGLVSIATMELLAEEAGAIPPRMYWPSNVSFNDVVAVVSRCKHPDARVVAASLRAGQWYVAAPGDPTRHRPGALFPKAENYVQRETAEGGLRVTIADPDLYRALGTVFHPRLAALVAWAEKDIEDARRRPFIAVDAGRGMQTVLEAWGREPWQNEHLDGRTGLVNVARFTKDERRDGFRVLVRSGNGAIQLSLPLDGVGASDVFDAVRRALGPEGLRHLAAFLLQLTTKGARSGRLLWRVTEHMEAMRVGADARRDPKAREVLTRAATAVARLQLEVYRDGKCERMRQALLQPINEAESLGADGRWTLEGATLEVHPLLWSGVRSASGEVGSHWFPTSPDLPSLHHVKHAPALLAGLRLPQRWRWAYGKHGQTFVDLTGANALELFGIEGDREHHKGRAWETFDANVGALAALATPAIGAVEWLRGGRTAAGVVRIHAARWMIDRIAHRIAPVEAPPPPPLRTGNDLRAWREARGITQAALAAALGVSLRTVKGAEGEGDHELPRSVRAAIAAGALSSPPSLPARP